MTFFKVIRNEEVISVGCVFLNWNETKHRLLVCDVDKGQFVQSFDEKYIFRDTWMKPAPTEAGEYPLAKIVIIDEREYEDLKELLEQGELIAVEKPAEINPQSGPQIEEPEEEKPITISEMRELIIKQQEQIKALMEKVN